MTLELDAKKIVAEARAAYAVRLMEIGIPSQEANEASEVYALGYAEGYLAAMMAERAKANARLDALAKH